MRCIYLFNVYKEFVKSKIVGLLFEVNKKKLVTGNNYVC